MPTVRRPSSFAARKIRMAISLRLAASSFRIGLFFFIPEPTSRLRETQDCFTQMRRGWSTFFDTRDKQFECGRPDALEKASRRAYLWTGSTEITGRSDRCLLPQKVWHS